MRINQKRFYPGIVTFNDLNYLNLSQSLVQQGCSLKEDLLHVKYPHNYLLDVGWYGSFLDPKKGFFRIVIIKNNDWQKPKYKLIFKDINLLKINLLLTTQYLKRNFL